MYKHLQNEILCNKQKRNSMVGRIEALQAFGTPKAPFVHFVGSAKRLLVSTQIYHLANYIKNYPCQPEKESTLLYQIA